jgi:site-specific DNA-cytosine methylase
LIADTLTSGSHPASNMPGRRREDDTNIVAFSHTQGMDAQPSAEAWPTLRTEGGGHAVGNGQGVRRLTPVECERLQGFPDGWTDHGPDSRRYAALGDAVTVPVAEWIGRRLMEAA